MGFTEMFIYHFINGILDLSILEQLNEPPDVFEIILTIKSLLSDKPAGSDKIPAELLKSGLEPLAVHIYPLMIKCWATKSVPLEFKDAKISTLYKNKCERGVFNNYRSIFLLNVTGNVFQESF